MCDWKLPQPPLATSLLEPIHEKKAIMAQAVHYHNKRGQGGSCIKGLQRSTLQTTLVLALKSL